MTISRFPSMTDKEPAVANKPIKSVSAAKRGHQPGISSGYFSQGEAGKNTGEAPPAVAANWDES
jgi:hypothetical protein